MFSVQSVREITGEWEVPNLVSCDPRLTKISEPNIPRRSGMGGRVSNVLRNNFFTVSRELVDGGHLGTLSGSAVKLYVLLMMLAQKHRQSRCPHFA